MKTKPFFITDVDYLYLKQKYPNEKDFNKMIDKINKNYPVQYAIGDVDFYGLTINVDERVLIPRFETELLVEKIINLLNNKKNLKILDLCTGSGCIAITLAKYLDSNVDAVDLSKEALNLAKQNAKDNNVNINFYQKDVLQDFDYPNKYDLIVSNPPYVKKEEFVTENTKYEPNMALYPGDDDIIFYKKIISYSKKILNKKGIIVFEIGSTQAKDIIDIIKRELPRSKVSIEKDYNNYNRYIFIFNE